MQNVNNFKIACYCLFNTVLNKLFHITDVYIFSTRQNNNWIYKKWPCSKVYIPLNLNTACHFLDDPQLFFCFVIALHESLVGPEQFNCSHNALRAGGCPPEKSSSYCTFFGFPTFLHIWTLSNSDCMNLRSIFSHGGQLGNSNIANIQYKVKTFTDAQDGTTMPMR